jgi:DNA polymerase
VPADRTAPVYAPRHPTPVSNGGTQTTKTAGSGGAKTKEEFTAMCESFVREARVRIEQTQQTETIQVDMFTPAEPEMSPLSLKERAAALAELAAEVAPCQECKLCGDRTQTVFGTGAANAGIVFIGEAPGREEDRQGEPFVGRAGKLLNEILKAIEFRRADVYICNILKCRPPGNRDPELEEVQACEPYLRRQLEIIQPKIICCLGRVAAQNLLGTRATLGALRESIHFYEGIPVLATFHPAALLRNPNWKRPAWDDVRKLRALYDALDK